VWDKSGFQECLNAACDSIGYSALRAVQKEARAKGRWFGIGIASYAELTGIGSRISVAPGMPINTGTEMANIRIDSTGAITAAFGVASHGQGLETTLAQVVADHLGARFEDIRIVHGDRRHRHVRQPQSCACRGPRQRSPRAQYVRRCLTPHRTCSKRRLPISSRKMEGFPSPARIARSRFAKSQARSIPRWAVCRRKREANSPPPSPTIRCSARPRRRRRSHLRRSGPDQYCEPCRLSGAIGVRDSADTGCPP
jgi:Molybdopterin cofactor-binding domain